MIVAEAVDVKDRVDLYGCWKVELEGHRGQLTRRGKSEGDESEKRRRKERKQKES